MLFLRGKVLNPAWPQTNHYSWYIQKSSEKDSSFAPACTPDLTDWGPWAGSTQIYKDGENNSLPLIILNLALGQAFLYHFPVKPGLSFFPFIKINKCMIDDPGAWYLLHIKRYRIRYSSGNCQNSTYWCVPTLISRHPSKGKKPISMALSATGFSVAMEGKTQGWSYKEGALTKRLSCGQPAYPSDADEGQGSSNTGLCNSNAAKHSKIEMKINWGIKILSLTIQAHWYTWEWADPPELNSILERLLNGIQTENQFEPIFLISDHTGTYLDDFADAEPGWANFIFSGSE